MIEKQPIKYGTSASRKKKTANHSSNISSQSNRRRRRRRRRPVNVRQYETINYRNIIFILSAVQSLNRKVTSIEDTHPFAEGAKTRDIPFNISWIDKIMKITIRTHQHTHTHIRCSKRWWLFDSPKNDEIDGKESKHIINNKRWEVDRRERKKQYRSSHDSALHTWNVINFPKWLSTF